MADLDVAVRLKFLTAGEEKLKNAARDLAAFGKASGKLSTAATGRLGGDLNKAYTASVRLGGALDKSAGAAARTAAGLNRIGNEARDIDRARAAVDRLANSERRLSGRLAGGALGGALGGAAGRRRERVREGLAEAASRISPEGYLLGAGGAVMAGAAIGGTAAAALGAGAVSTREAIARDRSMADIQKKVNLEAGDSYEALGRRIAGVSRKIGISYADAASIFAQGGQGGVPTRELEEFALLSAKTAAAWDVGARESAQKMTEVRAQTGWSIEQLQAFGDKVNFLGDVSAAAEKDVAEMFSRASAGAKAAGVSFDDSLVAMTALRSVGMQDEVAARFFGQFTSKLRNARGHSKDAIAAFKELGLSAKGVADGMQKDAMGTMIDFLERLSKSKDSVGIATSIFGAGWQDEVLRMKEALAEIVRLRGELASGRAAGSLDQALEKDLNTVEAKLNRFKQAWIDVGAQQFKPVADFIGATADRLTQSLDRWQQAQKRSADTRALATPVGRSVSDYERQFGLDRPIRKAGPAMMTQIEGATPHIDVKQIDQATADGVAKANQLYDALQKLNVTVSPSVNAGQIMGQLDAITAKANAAANALRALSTFGAPAVGGARVNPTLTGRGAGGSTGGGAAPATPAIGKQTRRAGGNLYAQNIHFHGVKDIAGAHRQLTRLANRQIRSSRDAALHDIG